jgi:hypothetical protein
MPDATTKRKDRNLPCNEATKSHAALRLSVAAGELSGCSLTQHPNDVTSGQRHFHTTQLPYVTTYNLRRNFLTSRLTDDATSRLRDFPMTRLRDFCLYCGCRTILGKNEPFFACQFLAPRGILDRDSFHQWHRWNEVGSEWNLAERCRCFAASLGASSLGSVEKQPGRLSQSLKNKNIEVRRIRSRYFE